MDRLTGRKATWMEPVCFVGDSHADPRPRQRPSSGFARAGKYLRGRGRTDWRGRLGKAKTRLERVALVNYPDPPFLFELFGASIFWKPTSGIDPCRCDHQPNRLEPELEREREQVGRNEIADGDKK